MSPALLLLGLGIAGATGFGGALALRLRAHLPALQAFSSGAVIAVALLDLLPEAIGLGAPTLTARDCTAFAALGLLCYRLLGQLPAGRASRAGLRPFSGPSTLLLHSLMDGLGIGLAFRLSHAAGLAVAVAVLAHDVVDGANMVTLTLSGGGRGRDSRRWLAANALAPLAGIALASIGTGRAPVPGPWLAAVLAFLAGGFLHIGAGQLLPRLQTTTVRTANAGLAGTALVGAGLAFIYTVLRLGTG